MKKILCALLSLITIILSITLSLFQGPKLNSVTYTPNVKGDISAVTFNCAAPWGNIIEGTGSGIRVKRFANYMNCVKPDIIGTQEMNSKWMNKLKELMPQYESYGVCRGGDSNESNSEMNSIFWLRDRFTCIEKNTFWLSNTPDTESKYQGAGCYRICSYVVLEDKNSGKRLIHMNTHLDNASDEARKFGADVILEKIHRLQKDFGDITVILTGDFNDIESGIPCLEITKKLTSCYSIMPENKESTYTDWGKLENDGEPIDFIFTNKTPVDYNILNDKDAGMVSDHYGVIAQINY